MAIVKQKTDVKEEVVEEQEVVETKESLVPVKHIVRVVSSGAPINGAVAVGEVEEYLAEQYERGYSLFGTHFLGIQPEGYAMMWILAAK